MLESKHTVLVVEDEVLIRMAAIQLVENAGYEVLEAQDADEAILILIARPDVRLVFTDVDMPGSMDGLRLSHFIRHRWPPVRIILASGKAILDESHLPSDARFFSKPYTTETITGAIAQMLA
jgi:two-component system, response regulator PdtaR